jgi:phosphoglycolate phosphatase-like HAD superfamily hydrolase
MGAQLDAILFDVDGVLIDSLRVKAEAFAAAFSDHPDRHDEIVALHLANGGVNRIEKISRMHVLAVGRQPTEAELAGRVDAFAAAVRAGVIAAPEIPGAEAALRSWTGRVPLHAVSATPQGELEAILEARGIASLLASVEGWPPAKSDLVGGLLGRCGYRPERCVVVGDSREDLAAATSNGTLFIQVSSANAPDFPEATTVIRDLTALDEAIHGLVAAPGH